MNNKAVLNAAYIIKKYEYYLLTIMILLILLKKMGVAIDTFIIIYLSTLAILYYFSAFKQAKWRVDPLLISTIIKINVMATSATLIGILFNLMEWPFSSINILYAGILISMCIWIIPIKYKEFNRIERSFLSQLYVRNIILIALGLFLSI